MSYRTRHRAGAVLAAIARLALLIALVLAITGIASVARAQDAENRAGRRRHAVAVVHRPCDAALTASAAR
jgi:hypothetical protein